MGLNQSIVEEAALEWFGDPPASLRRNTCEQGMGSAFGHLPAPRSATRKADRPQLAPGEPAAKPNRSTGVRDEVNSLGEVAQEIEHYNLDANPPFNDSDTVMRACAFLGDEVIMQAVSEAKDNFRKDDVRWQWSGTKSKVRSSWR